MWIRKYIAFISLKIDSTTRTWLCPRASKGFKTKTTGFLTFGNMWKNNSATRLFPDPVAAERKVFSPFESLTTLWTWTSVGLFGLYFSSNRDATAFLWSGRLELRNCLVNVGCWIFYVSTSEVVSTTSEIPSILVLRVLLLDIVDKYEYFELNEAECPAENGTFCFRVGQLTYHM